MLVVGGGTSGVAAGIQAARSGADAMIVEEGPWLGGMLTSAGVYYLFEYNAYYNDNYRYI